MTHGASKKTQSIRNSELGAKRSIARVLSATILIFQDNSRLITLQKPSISQPTSEAGIIPIILRSAALQRAYIRDASLFRENAAARALGM